MLHSLPIRFLQVTEDCFLLQMQDIPARNNTLLDLLFTNCDNLLDHIINIGSHGYTNHNMVEFKILQRTLEIRSRIQTLNFGRAKLSTSRAQPQGIPKETTMQGKQVCKCCEFFKNDLLNG